MNKKRVKMLKSSFEQAFGHLPNSSEFRLYKKLYVREGTDKLDERYKLYSSASYRPSIIHMPIASTAVKTTKNIINKLIFKFMTYTYTRDIIAIIIVLAMAACLFFVTVNETVVKTLIGVFGVIIGYYFGAKEVPILSVYRKRSEHSV